MLDSARRFFDALTVNRATGIWAAFLILWTATQVFYGAASPWATAATAAALGALYLTARWLLPEPLKLSKAALVFLAAVAAVFLLQLLPLPFLFPHAAALRRAHGVGLLWPATADVFLTVRSLALVTAYVLAALLVLKLRQGGLRSGDVLKGVTAVLVLQALYAIVQVAVPFKEIPFYGARATGAASGTLVNRNNFAGLMAMGLAAAAGLALRELYYGRPRNGNGFGWNRRIETGLLWGLAGGLFVAAIVLSQSRGGAMAALTAVAAIPFLWRGRASTAGILGLFMTGGAFVLVAGPEALMERFRSIDPFEIRSDQRMELWETTAAAALRQPLLGFGVGTHPNAYHPFQPPNLQGQVHHAHNEYVNAFFEGGLAWAALLLTGLAAWFWRVWRGLGALQGPDRIAPLAAMAAVLAEAIHSLVDFDLRITSVGMLFAIMVGLGASKLRSGRPIRMESIPAFLGLATAAAMALLPLDPAPVPEEARQAGAAQAEALLGRAAGLSPYDHRVAWMRARAAQRRGDREETDRRFLLAADLWPAHPDVQREAGLWFWEAFEDEDDRGYLERAARCLARLFLQQPGAVTGVMAEVWDPGRAAEDYEALLPRPEPGRAEPAAHLAGFLARKGRWREGMDLFDRAGARSARAHDVFAEALAAVGQWGLEATVREKRLAIQSDAWAYAAGARAWLRLGEHSRALEMASTAARIEPQSADWHALRAQALRARGDRVAAAEAYTVAIRCAPMEISHRMNRGYVYAELGLHEPASEDFREVLRSRPDDCAAAVGLSRGLSGLGLPVEARRVLDAWLSRHPEDAEIQRLRDLIKD
jgi:Flp pilus assembly protein TadD